MRKVEERLSWVLSGGAVGIVSLILLMLLFYGYTVIFYPRPLPTQPHHLLPFALMFCVPCGFMVGAMCGYELAPLSTIERKRFWFDTGVEGVLWLITSFVAHSVFGKVDPSVNFVSALFIESLPLVPIGLYHHWLRYRLKKLRP